MAKTTTTAAGICFSEHVATHIKRAMWRLRGMDVDPVAMGEEVAAAIKRLNPDGGATWVLLGDLMVAYAAVSAEFKGGKGGTIAKGAELARAIAIAMGKRMAEMLQLAAPGDASGGDSDGEKLEWTEALGRVMRVVGKERLDARAEARKSGDMRRVAANVGYILESENLDRARVTAAQNAVFDHGITHEKMVHFVNMDKTAVLFNGPEIRDGRQTNDLWLWCQCLEAVAEDVHYIAEVEASGNTADYAKRTKRQREEDAKEWGAIAAEAEAAKATKAAKAAKAYDERIRDFEKWRAKAAEAAEMNANVAKLGPFCVV